MNKKYLIASIAEKASLTIVQAEEAFNATFASIQDAMLAQESVMVAGFGNFGTKVRAERKGRNPKTRETIAIAKAIVPSFKAGPNLKKLVNSVKA